MKTKRRLYLLAVGALLAILLLGCAKPAQPNPPPTPVATPQPEPVPVVPGPAPAEPEPTPPEVVAPPSTPEPPPPAEAVRVDVVFFHRTQQCHSCEYAEVQVQKTLDEHFADELASGLVTSQSINMDEESSDAITEKYAAYGSQLFITAVNGDEEVTEEVLEFWDFIDDDEGFSGFIVDKVNQALASLG